MSGLTNEKGQKFSDAELVRLTLEGETNAFGEIVRRYQGKIYGMARFQVRNSQNAEDLTQEIFLATFESLARFDASRSFTNWILKIATHHCCNYLRKKNVTQPFDSAFEDDGKWAGIFDDPVEKHINRELRESVLRAFFQLSEEFKLVIWLYYFFERSYDQISEILEIPIHLVKIRLFRGKQALGKILGPKGSKEPKPIQE